MTYGELYDAFIRNYDDGCGVICATSPELLPALKALIAEFGQDSEINKDTISTRLTEMNFNKGCVDDIFWCIKTVR